MITKSCIGLMYLTLLPLKNSDVKNPGLNKSKFKLFKNFESKLNSTSKKEEINALNVKSVLFLLSPHSEQKLPVILELQLGQYMVLFDSKYFNY